MVIKSIVARNISIPLKRPITNSAFSFSNCSYTLVNIMTEDGIDGWGFAFGAPQTKAMVEEFARSLIGESVDIKRLWHKLYASRSARFDRGGISMRAISAIDIALWDILGKYAKLPLYRMFGAYREKVPVYYSGGHYPSSYTKTAEVMEYLEKDIGTCLERGFSAYKMKIGGASCKVDLERIALARSLLGSDRKLMLDAFCAYRPEEIIPMAAKFERYDIAWLEEPVTLDDTPGYALVASKVSMPIAMGEGHYIPAQFRDIIDHDAARILMPDVTYVGGFTGFASIAAVAAYKGLQLSPHWCHDLSVQLALCIPEISILEYMDANSALFLLQKVIVNPVLAKDGFVTAPGGYGHGLILDEDAVSRYLD